MNLLHSCKEKKSKKKSYVDLHKMKLIIKNVLKIL